MGFDLIKRDEESETAAENFFPSEQRRQTNVFRFQETNRRYFLQQ